MSSAADTTASNNSNRHGTSTTQQQQQQHNHHHNPVTTVGPRAKCDQVIYEAICKVCEIIVGSRSTSSSNNITNNTTTNHNTTTTTTTSSSSTSSSRFNLQIPEVTNVRTILSQYRLQLHVPIRVDVYYYNDTNNDSTTNTNTINTNNTSSSSSSLTNRILLERWCIEYTNLSTGIEKFIQNENIITNDPMIHLTHICKRIVVYIRTLYCIVKLLPCHTILQNMNFNNNHNTTQNNHRIGFSIYINTDYNMNDMNELIQNHGFIYHQNQNQNHRISNNNSNNNHHPNGVVITPYGELTWQVLYCPISKLESLSLIPKFLLRTTPNHHHLGTRINHLVVSRSQPIPMQTKSNHKNHTINNSNSNDDDDNDNNNDNDTNHNNTNNNKYQTFAAPHSAPSTTWMPKGLPSPNTTTSTTGTTTYTERSQQQQMLHAQQLQQQQQHHHQHHPVYTTTGMSYDPNRQYQYQQYNQQHHQHHHPPIYKKSMTTVSELNHNHQHQQQTQQSTNHPFIVQRSHSTMGNVPSSTTSTTKSLSTSPRMNSIASTSTTTPKMKTATTNTTSSSNDNPRRVMSGLSLALLMASNDDDNDDPKDIDTVGTNNNNNNNKSTIFRMDNSSSNSNNHDSTYNLVDNVDKSISNNNKDHDDDSKTQRRAALHQMPPHLLEQQQQQGLTKPTSSLSMVGDYGYGYNNHIPWQKIHPSQSNPTVVTQQQQQQQQSLPSPHPLLYHNNSFGPTQLQSLSSSPSNYSTGNNNNTNTNFYSTCTSPIQPHFVTGTSYNNNNNTTSSSTTTSPQNAFFFKSTTPTLSHLIPPRNRTDTSHTNAATTDTTTTATISTPTITGTKNITPPFPSRPIGFMHDTPPTLLLEPSLYSNINPTSNSIRYASDAGPSSHHAPPSSLASTTINKNVAPITSLDSLRSSPFQHTADRHSPMLSSSSLSPHIPVIPPPISGFESDYITAVQMSLGGSNDNTSLRRSLWSTSNSSSIMPSSLAGFGGRQYQSYLFQDPHKSNHDDTYLSEEMPFALEIQSPFVLDETNNMTSEQQQQQQSITKGNSTMSKTNNVGAASSTFGAASSLATLAQKCSVPNQRLKMFDKGTTTNDKPGDGQRDSISNIVRNNIDDVDLTNSLADQLQEFRAFGASLHISTSASVLQTQENTTTTNTHVGFDEEPQQQQQLHINNILSGSGTSSTSTPISLRS